MIFIVPPSPPTRPDVIFISANAISIKWDVPYADGGSKVTGYWIEKKERNTILWVRENKLPCLDCQYKVSNLIEGLEYQFRVYAMNLAGLSKASEASRPVVALNPVGKKIFTFTFILTMKMYYEMTDGQYSILLKVLKTDLLLLLLILPN